MTKRLLATAVAGAVLAVPLLSACSGAGNSDSGDFVGVCTDPVTQERVDDSHCGSDRAHSSDMAYVWLFYAWGASVPRVGQHYTAYPNYKRTLPPRTRVSTVSAPKNGGKITKPVAKTAPKKNTWPQLPKSNGGGTRVNPPKAPAPRVNVPAPRPAPPRVAPPRISTRR